MKTGDVLAGAAKSASYNMLLQLGFRLLTFALNAFTLHYISKDMLGVVNVRLFLLYTTVLFLSREAFRRACLSKTADDKWHQVINLVWCTVPLGMIWAGVLSLVWMYLLQVPDPKLVANYNLGVLAFAIASVIELLSEPLFIISQLLLFVRLKVLIEGVSLAVRCLVIVILLLAAPHLGLIIFAIAHIILAVTTTILYYVYFIRHTYSGNTAQDFPFKSFRDFFPKFKYPLISWSLAELTVSFFKQSFLKQILTEGERYVMTIFGVLSFGDQGIYDVINNLGSLAARFIFLPIEESAYLLFSQTLKRGGNIKEQNKDLASLSSEVFESLLKIVTLIGLTILVFGFAYSFLLLDIYGGSLLSSGSGPSLLRWYCVYVLLIAVNGVSEGFVFATMHKEEVDRYNKMLLVFSVVFLLTSWYLTRVLGSVGFILANCFNMSVRIAHSLHYLVNYYRGSEYRPWQGVVPSAAVMVAYGASLLITAVMERLLLRGQGWIPRLIHVGIGGTCLLITIGTIYITEYRLVAFIKLQYQKRQRDAEREKVT